MLENKMYLSVYMHSPIGLVVVDDLTNLVEVNEYMKLLFFLQTDSFHGKRFGNVFQCANLSHSETCGSAAGCLHCDLHNGVISTLKQNAVMSDVVLQHNFRISEAILPKWFKVSANSFVSRGKKFAVISFVDITNEKLFEEMLLQELTLDLATGVMNKASLLEALRQLAKGLDKDTVYSIGIVDFDDFKFINDNFGHLRGDEVLTDFAKLARGEIRSQDIIGRYGGEEFIFIFPGVDIHEAEKIIKRIHANLVDAHSPEMEVSFSAGFMELSTEYLKNTCVSDMISTIDAYLYAAKKAGKHRLCTGSGMACLN